MSDFRHTCVGMLQNVTCYIPSLKRKFEKEIIK